MGTLTRDGARRQKAGGLAALYLALAYFVAIPYFLLVVDYPGATTAADRVALITGNYASMYAMHIATYVLFGIALGVLALVLHDRLRVGAPLMARVATAVGVLWSFALVASGMVFTYGMTTVVNLAKSDPEQARSAWQAIEPVAQGLGGAGGETLGGLWVVLVSWLVVQGRLLPKALGWFGVATGVVGLVSVVPPLHEAAYAFGLLQIAWFVWIGVVLTTTTKAAPVESGGLAVAAAAPAK